MYKVFPYKNTVYSILLFIYNSQSTSPKIDQEYKYFHFNLSCSTNDYNNCCLLLN